MSGTEIAASLRGSMDSLEALIAPLPESSCEARDGAWSVKETLSHLLGPEGETFLDGVQRIVREDEPALDVQPGITHYHADRRAARAGDLLRAVVGEYRAMADVFEMADAETLNRRAHIELMGRTPFGEHPTLAEWGEVTATFHVAGHVRDLRAHVERMSSQAHG
jgi:hypothetical protein